MTAQAWLTLLAIITGPLSVFALTRWRDKARDKRNRRFSVFRELMVTRGSTLAGRHVEALNAIDVDFYGDRDVIGAWKLYFDHLCQVQPANEAWFQQKENLLVDLLFEMAKSLDLHFDKATIKRNRYSPQGYLDAEIEAVSIRRGLAEVLTGQKRLPMDVDFADDFKAFVANAAKQGEAAKSESAERALPSPEDR